MGWILKFHILGHVVEDLERFGNFSFTDKALFEHFNLRLKRSCRMRFRPLSTKIQVTVQNKENAVCRVQGGNDGVKRRGCDAAGMRKWQRLERERRHLVRNEICLSLEEMAKLTETGGTGLFLENRYGWMLVELFRKEALLFLQSA